MKTTGPCGATCEVWLKSSVILKRKLGLIVFNSCIMCMLQKIFKFNLAVNFLYFLSNWVNLDQIFDALEMNNLAFMRVLKNFSEIFL